MPANVGYTQCSISRFGRAQKLDQCRARLRTGGEVQAEVEQNPAQFRAVAGNKLHRHGPAMPVPIGCGDTQETPPRVLIPITGNRQNLDWRAEPGPDWLPLLVFADAVFHVTIATTPENRGQRSARNLGSFVEFRGLLQ